MENLYTEKMLGRRSIRKFKDEMIDEKTMDLIFNLANRTASSTGMQLASIIRVKDKKVKEEIAQVAKQAYIAEFPELLIFLVDCYRNAQILHELDKETENIHDMDRFFQGFTDAVLMAQNVATSCEIFGLGSVFLGSIHNNSKKIVEILDLPKFVFPALGLGLGIADQKPMLKPRMDLSLKVFTDKYERFDGKYLENFKDYDLEMLEYYDLRDSGKSDSFTSQVAKKTGLIIEKRKEILNFIEDQGFTK